MKLNYLFICLLLYQSSLCQEYYFDNILEYDMIKSINTTNTLINSKDNTYFLTINYNGNSRDTLYSTIIDTKRKIIHDFVVTANKDIYTFKYLFSKELKKYNSSKNFVYETTKNIIDSTHSNYKIKVFSNKRKKRIECDINIIVEKSDFLFANNFVKYLSHSRMDYSDFFIINGILKNYKIEFNNRSNSEFRLKNIKPINTKLTVKKEEINYKQ